MRQLPVGADMVEMWPHLEAFTSPLQIDLEPLMIAYSRCRRLRDNANPALRQICNDAYTKAFGAIEESTMTRLKTIALIQEMEKESKNEHTENQNGSHPKSNQP
jgi:hypothetical protein